MLGMLLDQQVPMEWAFRAPALLKERLGGTLDAGADRGDAGRGRRGRLPGQAGAAPVPRRRWRSARTRSAQFLVEHYDGRAENVWAGAATGDELLARVKALPGFGNDKARIFVGLLGKRLGVRPPGWEQAAADWAVDRRRRQLRPRHARSASRSAR